MGGGKWIYTIKRGPTDEETFKARYVAKGYSQVPGIDFHETFPPTAKMNSVSSNGRGLQCHYQATKTVFVCKLNKSLYGLRESGRSWDVLLHNYLLRQGFQ